jgi:hypothetical protein
MVMTQLAVSALDIQRKVSESAFGKPLITNVLRGHVAEAIVATALEPDWRWCSADYASWDFDRADGVRLEVKQSAARQSWAIAAARRSKPSFDIAARTGRWDESGIWVPEAGRQAQIYVFAYHGIDDDEADHRSPEQWTFYVLAADRLPDTKRIGMASLRQLTGACRYPELRSRVDQIADHIVKGAIAE